MISLLYALIVTQLLCLAAWGYFVKTNNPGIIDVTWSLGIFSAGLVYFVYFQSYQHLNFALTITWILYTLWAIRLSGWLWYTRVRVHHVDQRYESLAQNWKTDRKLAFLANFAFQGVLMVLISMPFLFIATSSQPHPFNITILNIIIIVALIGESLADWQLYQFKKNNTGICHSGLWKYSRHPNYFCDWAIWCSFAIIGFMQDFGIFAFISPLALTYVMLELTIPITENSSKEHHGTDFEQYCQHTPMFFPSKLPWFNSLRQS